MTATRPLHRYRPRIGRRLIIGGALVLGALEVLALQRSRRQRRQAETPKRLAA
jgi:hypothetical protein